MLRIVTTAAILALTVASAQAVPTLKERIHAAAVKGCTEGAAAKKPITYYGAMIDACVDRVTRTVGAKYEAEALARTTASTASLGE